MTLQSALPFLPILVGPLTVAVTQMGCGPGGARGLAGDPNRTVSADGNRTTATGLIDAGDLPLSHAIYAVGKWRVAGRGGYTQPYYPLTILIARTDLCPGLSTGGPLNAEFISLGLDVAGATDFEVSASPPQAGDYIVQTQATGSLFGKGVGSASALYFPPQSFAIDALASSAIAGRFQPDGDQIWASAGTVTLAAAPEDGLPLSVELDLQLHTFAVNSYHAIFADKGLVDHLSGPLVAAPCPAMIQLLDAANPIPDG